MSKSVGLSYMNHLLDELQSDVTRIVGVSADPTTASDVVTNNTVFSADVSSGDMTIANEGTGRKITFPTQQNQSALITGNLTHIVCLTAATTGEIPYKTDVTSTAVTQNGILNIGAFSLTIPQPA